MWSTRTAENAVPELIRELICVQDILYTAPTASSSAATNRQAMRTARTKLRCQSSSCRRAQALADVDRHQISRCGNKCCLCTEPSLCSHACMRASNVLSRTRRRDRAARPQLVRGARWRRTASIPRWTIPLSTYIASSLPAGPHHANKTPQQLRTVCHHHGEVRLRCHELHPTFF